MVLPGVLRGKPGPVHGLQDLGPHFPAGCWGIISRGHCVPLWLPQGQQWWATSSNALSFLCPLLFCLPSALRVLRLDGQVRSSGIISHHQETDDINQAADDNPVFVLKSLPCSAQSHVCMSNLGLESEGIPIYTLG